MAKGHSANPGKRAPSAEAPPAKADGFLRMATLATLAALVVIAGLNLHETRQQRSNLEERLSLLDGQIGALGNKVDALSKAAAPPRPPAGPDPNRVYAIRTDGSPAAGPKGAPVTIAEFSDFQ